MSIKTSNFNGDCCVDKVKGGRMKFRDRVAKEFSILESSHQIVQCIRRLSSSLRRYGGCDDERESPRISGRSRQVHRVSQKSQSSLSVRRTCLPSSTRKRK